MVGIVDARCGVGKRASAAPAYVLPRQGLALRNGYCYSVAAPSLRGAVIAAFTLLTGNVAFSERAERRTAGGARLRARAGLTLLELLIVTAILSILALAAVGPVRRARDRAMTATARAEMTQMLRGAEMYNAIHGRLPASYQALATVDYRMSDDLQVCRFDYAAASGSTPDRLTVELRHRGTSTGVRAVHSSLQSSVSEVELATCTDVRSSGGTNAGNTTGGNRGNNGRGNGRGRR